MSLSNEELLSKIKQFADVDLTLFNDKGETHYAGSITTLVHTAKGIKLRWRRENPFSNVFPLTYAVVHRGSRVWNVINIKPLPNNVEGTELELDYDY